MTDEEINKAIAIHLGWQGVVSDPILGVMGLPPSINDGDHLHIRTAMWTKDLNAMHEAEKTVFGSSNMWVDFMEHLCDATGAVNTSMVDAMVIIIQATVKQRAEAFLRTLGKWEEGK
jgi:hypothetical protein